MLLLVWSLQSSYYELHNHFEHGEQRNAQGTEFWSSGFSSMLDPPSVYVDEVLHSSSESGVATFNESNTYGNDMSQKSCSFPSPFI